MIFETFARRKKQLAKAGQPDVFSYDEAPPQLRHQLCMAIHEGIGIYHFHSPYGFHDVPCANDLWAQIDHICHKEIYAYLCYAQKEDKSRRYLEFLLNADDIDDFLSALEIGCVALSVMTSPPSTRGAEVSASSALEEINWRFVQHAVGYRYEAKHIIRVDSEFAHAEIIKPALSMLSRKEYSSVNAEFMTAHRHYRSGSFKDAITAANRSFESMLKTICDLKNWPYNKGDRASELITLVNSKGLFSHQFDKSFSSYIAMMKTGLPTIRNDVGAHGDGLKAAAVTAQVARFAINMTASNLLFLAESIA